MRTRRWRAILRAEKQYPMYYNRGRRKKKKKQEAHIRKLLALWGIK